MARYILAETVKNNILFSRFYQKRKFTFVFNGVDQLLLTRLQAQDALTTSHSSHGFFCLFYSKIVVDNGVWGPKKWLNILLYSH